MSHWGVRCQPISQRCPGRLARGRVGRRGAVGLSAGSSAHQRLEVSKLRAEEAAQTRVQVLGPLGSLAAGTSSSRLWYKDEQG